MYNLPSNFSGIKFSLFAPKLNTRKENAMTDELWRVAAEVESVNGVREVSLITNELMNRKI